MKFVVKKKPNYGSQCIIDFLVPEVGESSLGRFLPCPCLVILFDGFGLSEDWSVSDSKANVGNFVDVLMMGERRLLLVVIVLKFEMLFFRATSHRSETAKGFCNAFEEKRATSVINSPLISSSSKMEYGSSEAPVVSCSSISRFVEMVIAVRVSPLCDVSLAKCSTVGSRCRWDALSKWWREAFKSIT